MKNNKNFIPSTFLSLLIVGCSNASSNLPSSSSTTSSSSSGFTGEPRVTNTKVPFNQIGSLVAQVVDAKALGVSNGKDYVSAPRGRRQAQDDVVDSSEQNKIVKVAKLKSLFLN
jgi:hypothetical protein